MDQTNIDLLRSELERDEGWRTAPYQCSTGYWTVGVGWNIEARGLPGGLKYYVSGRGGRTRTTPVNIGVYDAVRLAEAGFVLNRAEIDRLLDISIGDAIRDARAVLPGFDELSGPRQRAFANMAFNLGRQRLARFVKMVAAAKQYDWCEVSRQMLDSKWARQVGPRADRLAEMVLEDG